MDQMPNTEPKKPRRRWFQFRLRTLLIGVVLLSVPFRYVAHEARIVRARKAWLATHSLHGCSSHPNANSLVRRLLGDDEYNYMQTDGANDSDEAKQHFPEAEVVDLSNGRLP